MKTSHGCVIEPFNGIEFYYASGTGTVIAIEVVLLRHDIRYTSAVTFCVSDN